MKQKSSTTGKSQIVHRAYKAELKLNNRQRTLCYKHAGCARFAYNWGLQRKIEEYARTGKSPSSMDLHRELNKLKKTEFSWMYEVSKCAPQEVLRNLDNAFRQFFNRVKRGERPGFPKFKSRKRGKRSFRLTGVIRVFNNSIKLPRLGRLRLKERGYLRSESVNIHILSATVSEKAGRWYISLQVKEKIKVMKNTGPMVGVDLGVKHLATLSDGTVFECSQSLRIYERKIKRLQRSLSRKQEGSHNQRKVKSKLQKIHARVVNARKDAIHKVTAILTKTKSIVVIEDLNVNSMRQNHILTKSVSDAGL
jgi:putative transposase